MENKVQSIEPQGIRPQWLTIALLGLGLVLGVVVGVIVLREPPQGNRKPDGITPEQARQYVESKNVAIGQLENELERGDGLAEADKRFVQLREQLPDELLPRMNLAVCRLLELRAKNKSGTTAERQVRDAAVTQMREALDDLLAAAPDSGAAYWLQGRFHLLLRDSIALPDFQQQETAQEQELSQAIAAFLKATELDASNPSFWFELYSARNLSSLPTVKDSAGEALKQAYQLAPTNLFLLCEWLLVQAQRQDATIVDTIAAAREVVRPLESSVRRHGYDLSEFLDQAAGAATSGNWPVAQANARRVWNFVKSEEVAQSDVRRINLYPLEFVVFDFGAPFYDKLKPAKPESSPPITVKLKLAATDQQPPNLPDVHDAVLVDFDLDGTLDLLVLHGQTLAAYTRASIDGPWQLATTFELPVGFERILAADLDRDELEGIAGKSGSICGSKSTLSAGAGEKGEAVTVGCREADVDLVVYGPAGMVVLRNELDKESKKRTLAVVEQSDEWRNVKDVVAATFVDFDHDSDLDLAIATRHGVQLWSDLGNMTFENASGWSTLPASDVLFTSLVIVDWDRDADIDVILGTADGKAPGLLENMRHGQFRFVWLDEKLFDAPAPSLAVLESDGNLSWDLVGGGAAGLRLTQTATLVPGKVKPQRTQVVATEPYAGIAVWDCDNDGQMDVVSWSDKGLAIYRGGADGSLAAAPGVDESSLAGVQLCRVGDLDNDGDQDLTCVTPDGVVLVINEGGNQNQWIDIRAVGCADNSGRSNHGGVGSLVEVRSGRVYQAQTVIDQTTHFGLGQNLRPDAARIVWPNGMPQNIVSPPRDHVFCEPMFLKGSCPFVYTGRRDGFEFLTDCLWSAPLGLQIAEGVLAPARPWEYLRVPGERLEPRNGAYELQITEELWEAAYFDHVQLIAIDHPADVEIYSNEKVGPAEIAPFQIHTVRQPRRPIAAHDQQRRDVMDKIRDRDGDFLRAFDKKLRQGLTEEHYLELELGPLDQPRQVTLFLTGWIKPTDTSLNIAFSQNPELDGPHLPSVWVPDADGQWRETVSYMGFPGGKTKTIAVDLSDAFLTNDYRLRIKTTAEIYWDEVFFTIDEEPAPVKQTPLALASADLHFRGFSRRAEQRENAPDTYLYDEVSTAPQWPPMRGNFTRYGDVTELLTDADDRLAIIGAGDEITLRFPVPNNDPRAGWKRDFILHSVGWDKDADLNTVYGQTVEPLPFQAMTSYPYQADGEFPDTAQHRQYLREYQARPQPPAAFWRQLSKP